MRQVEMPWFIRPPYFDEMILAGTVPSVNVRCLECGVYGVFHVWHIKENGDSICPACRGCNTERVEGLLE